MRIAIQFHDQFALDAHKIRNERSYTMLPPKFQPCKLSISQASPKLLFCRRGFMTHFARAIQESWRKARARLHCLLSSKDPLTLTLSPAYGGEGTNHFFPNA